MFKIGMIGHFQFVHDCECKLLFKIYWSGIKNFYLIITLDFEGASNEFILILKDYFEMGIMYFYDLPKFWKDAVNVLRESLYK